MLSKFVRLINPVVQYRPFKLPRWMIIVEKLFKSFSFSINRNEKGIMPCSCPLHKFTFEP